jgi:hypothetical protein
VAIPLHLPPGGKDFLARLADIFALGNERATNFWESVLSPHEYSDHLASGEPLRIGDLAISFAPMVHYIPVWALRIEEVSTGRTLTYSADTGPAAPLVEFAADSDLFLCEATLLQQAPSEAPGRRGTLPRRGRHDRHHCGCAPPRPHTPLGRAWFRALSCRCAHHVRRTSRYCSIRHNIYCLTIIDRLSGQGLTVYNTTSLIIQNECGVTG